jgi:hypothetical protein
MATNPFGDSWKPPVTQLKPVPHVQVQLGYTPLPVVGSAIPDRVTQEREGKEISDTLVILGLMFLLSNLFIR